MIHAGKTMGEDAARHLVELGICCIPERCAVLRRGAFPLWTPIPSSFLQGLGVGGFCRGSAELALEACVFEPFRSEIRLQFRNLLGRAGRECVSIGEMGSSGSDVTAHSPLSSARSVLPRPRCDTEEAGREISGRRVEAPRRLHCP
jgi:hypothetical protein